MSSRNQQRGLTIIEILVVVAIVVILIGFLLPSLATYNRRPTFVMCKNNMRHVTAALALYAQEHNINFPDLDQQPGNAGSSALILLSSLNYVESTNAFICPAVAQRREKQRHFYQKRFVPQLNKAFFVSNGNDYAYYDGLSVGSATNAILADRFAWTNRAGIDDKILNHSRGMINVGFTDAHVDWIKPNIIIGTNLTPPWSKVLDPIRVP
jgi:prepilin-type N-terminal cleavage/methylation domain-containing protein